MKIKKIGLFTSIFLGLTVALAQTVKTPADFQLTYGEPKIRIIEKPRKPIVSEDPLFSPLVWAQLGVGITQARYAQGLPYFFDMSYSDNQGPTTSFQAGGWLHHNWGLEAYYKNTPGDIKSSASLDVYNGDYNFQSIGLDILWRAHPVLKEQKFDCYLKLGIHQHDLPFLIAVSPVLISRQLNSLRTLSLGFEVHKKLRKNWRLEGGARYQYPFTSASDIGADLKVSPSFTADGSLGLLYRFPKYTTFGIYWTGEWHDYDYEYSGGLYNLNFSGYQNLFQSTFDIKMGVEF